MTRPIIGISANFIEDKQQIMIRETYTNAVIEAGGLPFILPTVSNDEVICEMLSAMDGLLLSGGGDVDPAYYHEARKPECGEASPRRDDFEFRIARKALELRMPIFGICRGIQVLNVVYGGKLIQDLPSTFSIPLERHRQPEPYNAYWHEVFLTEGGLLSRVTGLEKTMANSMHHQAIDVLGSALVIEGESPDGIIEAVSDSKNPAVFGVQFHPEYLTENSEFAKALFSYFVKMAAEYHSR